MKPQIQLDNPTGLPFDKPSPPSVPRLFSGNSLRTVSLASLRPGGRLEGPSRIAYVVQNSPTNQRLELLMRGIHYVETYHDAANRFYSYTAKDALPLWRRVLVALGVMT